MRIAVAGDLVSGRSDLVDQARQPFGYPAEDEKGGVHAVPTEEIEHQMRISVDASRQPVPICHRYHCVHGVGMKVLFDVDGESVDERAASFAVDHTVLLVRRPQPKMILAVRGDLQIEPDRICSRYSRSYANLTRASSIVPA
jgi:hypothetical protein